MTMGKWIKGIVGAAVVTAGLLAGAGSAYGAYAVSTTPNAHDFGSQSLGSASAPFTFTLRVTCDEDVANPGTCLNPHPFTPNVTVTGDFAIRDNGCTSTMPGNAFFGTTCTFNVLFAPAATGARSGIVDVGEPGGFAKAAVTGNGVAVPTVPSPVPTTAKKKKCRKHRSASAAKKRCKKRR
jgi:hypothetical protein